jgi:hypothetical protein
MISLISLPELLVLIIVAVGASFVVTGSTLGYPLRWLAFKILGWVGRGPVWLDSLVRCPYCHAWWEGLFWAIITGHPIWQSLQVAFAACGVAAIVQAQWSLAAGTEDYMREGKADE